MTDIIEDEYSIGAGATKEAMIIELPRSGRHRIERIEIENLSGFADLRIYEPNWTASHSEQPPTQNGQLGANTTRKGYLSIGTIAVWSMELMNVVVNDDAILFKVTNTDATNAQNYRILIAVDSRDPDKMARR